MLKRTLLTLCVMGLPLGSGGSAGAVPVVAKESQVESRLASTLLRANNLFFASAQSEGQSYLVADHWDGPLARLVMVRLGTSPLELHGWANVDPRLPDDRNTMSPSIVYHDGIDWLYFLAAPSDTNPAQVFRVQIGTPTSRFAELVTLNAPIGPRSWPRFVALVSGDVGVAYRDAYSRVRIAISRNGTTFEDLEARVQKGAMVSLADMSDGQLVMSYQVGKRDKMQSWFSVFGGVDQKWSDPVLVNPDSTNVHDTSFFARLDGSLDMYFISPNASSTGFAVWRRCLLPHRRLGKIELVLDMPNRSFTKPYVFRNVADSIVLTVSDMSRESGLHIFPISAEAMCPEGISDRLDSDASPSDGMPLTH